MTTQRVVPEHLVEQIREEYKAGGISQARLAVKYGLGDTTMNRILNHLGAYQQVSIKQQPMPELSEAERLEANKIAERAMAMLKGEGPKEGKEFLVHNPFYGRK